MKKSRGLCAVVLAGALSTAGCGALFRSHDVTPAGLARSDARLRDLLAAGSADTALVRLGQPKQKHIVAPSDELLRLLYEGVVAYHAGQYDSSASFLDRATQVLDDRDAFDLSREAAALVSSDRALPYRPSPAERLLIPYYGALSYLRHNQIGEAAVEARRLSSALQSLEDEPGEAEAKLRGLLRYFAGAVFERAGEQNDAGVAYRNAAVLLGDSVLPGEIPPDSGDVLVLLEEGFVAHRVEHSLTIVLATDEAVGLRDNDRQRRDETATAVATRALAQALQPAALYEEGERSGKRHWFVPAPERPHEKRECKTEKSDSTKSKDMKDCDDDDGFYLLRLAWPAYHAIRKPALEARIVLADSSSRVVPLFVSVSDAVVQDFSDERAKILARTIARAAAKLALTKSAEASVGKKNESLGKLVGTIANVSGAVLEQADTRSWTLLPAGIGLVRIRLPAGTQRLGLEIGGKAAPTSERHRDLGEVQVRGGGLSFVTARTWE